MLIATLTTILLVTLGLGGSKLDNVFVDIKKPVKQVVEDKERRSKILDVRKGLEKALRKNQKAWNKQIAAILDSQADHASTPKTFAEQQKRIQELLSEKNAAVLGARERMRALMTKEEWKAVFAED